MSNTTGVLMIASYFINYELFSETIFIKKEVDCLQNKLSYAVLNCIPCYN